MDATPGTMLRMLVPKLPLILKTAAAHTIRMSETSSKWDLRTELTVNVLRSFVTGDNPSSVSKSQKGSLRDPGIKGPLWISKVDLPAPADADAVRDLVCRAVDDLHADPEPAQYLRPDAAPVTAEWTGHRAGAGKDEPLPDIPEEAKFAELMKENGGTPTILYFHGGAYYLMDPASHRSFTSNLARLSGGRVLSVRYRLAPQHPFPAALVDALFAYLYLLYPPPGSFHQPVPASSIVFAGDSAGGNLSFALLGLLLHLRRTNGATVAFHGAEVPLPLPAGVATNSPWLDITRSMPSVEHNAKYDYLPPRREGMVPIPPCDLWPTTPPRADLFVTASLLAHPLVSPLAAPADFWRGSPPLFFVLGEEMLEDEDRVVARRAAAVGVPVEWLQFEAMPHCFGMLFAGTPGTKRCYAAWADFCKRVAQGESVTTKGTFVAAKTMVEEAMDVTTMRAVDDAEVARLMEEVKKAKVEEESGMLKSVAKL